MRDWQQAWMKCVALVAPAGSIGPLLVIDAQRHAFESDVAADGGAAVVLAELEELGVVGDARDHLAHVDRPLAVHRHDAQQLLGVVARRLEARARLAGASRFQSMLARISRAMRIASRSSSAR